MKGGKSVISIRNTLKVKAPFATLQATSRGGIVVKVDYADALVYRSFEDMMNGQGIIIPQDSYRGPDIPASVINSLKAQLREAEESMRPFYEAAMTELAPELVFRAINGEKVEYRREFQRVINDLISMLADPVMEAFRGIPVCFSDAIQVTPADIPNCTATATVLLRVDGMRPGAQPPYVFLSGCPEAAYFELRSIAQRMSQWVEIAQFIRRLRGGDDAE